MKSLHLLFFLFLLVIFVVPCFSQTSSLTSGTITAIPTTPCPSGALRNFQYLGIDTNINGLAIPTPGAMMSECYSDCCNYGAGFKIRDVFLGNNHFHNVSGPVVINGTTYTGTPFRGSLNINGTIRVPFYLRKKQNITLLGKVTLTGYLSVYLDPIQLNANNPFYSKTISDPNAIATITIRPRAGDSTRFDVISLRYDFINQN